MDFEELLAEAVHRAASDIFIVVGLSLSIKIKGTILPVDDSRVMPATADELISTAYALAGRNRDILDATGDDDFSLSVKSLSRFRVSAYKQRGTLAAVIRVVPFDIPYYKDLEIPDEVISISEKTKGLVLALLLASFLQN